MHNNNNNYENTVNSCLVFGCSWAGTPPGKETQQLCPAGRWCPWCGSARRGRCSWLLGCSRLGTLLRWDLVHKTCKFCANSIFIWQPCTLPVIVSVPKGAVRAESPLWYDDIVTGTECSPSTPVSSCISSTVYSVCPPSPQVIADHSVLYAAVTSLLSDTVLVVLTN